MHLGEAVNPRFGGHVTAYLHSRADYTPTPLIVLSCDRHVPYTGSNFHDEGVYLFFEDALQLVLIDTHHGYHNKPCTDIKKKTWHSYY